MAMNAVRMTAPITGTAMSVIIMTTPAARKAVPAIRMINSTAEKSAFPGPARIEKAGFSPIWEGCWPEPAYALQEICTIRYINGLQPGGISWF